VKSGGETTCLVLDVGGTTLRAASYATAGDRLTNVTRLPTPSHWNMTNGTVETIWPHLRSVMQTAGETALGGREPDVVCVAFPGPIDPRGRLLAAPTVWGSVDSVTFPLAEQLSAIWPKSLVHVINDITAAGYGYVTAGREEFCIVTVSSGIGHKVFLDGRPVTGPGGRGGEIGHLRVDHSPDAPLCDCGFPGHLGAVASGRGVLTSALRLAREFPAAFEASSLARGHGASSLSFDADALAAAFRAGDEWTCQLVATAAAYLGHALAAVHTIVGVEQFIIVGGFAFALGERYLHLLADAAAGQCWDVGQQWRGMIAFGVEDDSSGLIGAGRYAGATGQSRGRRTV